MNRRILVFTVDLVPFAGQPAYGGGLRAWGLGEALRAAGHDVVYSVPAELLEGRAGVPRELAEHAFRTGHLQDVINKAAPDVLLFEQWGLLDHLEEDGIPTVVDLHGSLILENTFRGQLNWSVNAEAKIRALRKVDLVITPGRRQADYFKPWLMLAGQNPRTLPVEVVPVSMPPKAPARKKTKDKSAEPVFVMGGNLWPWIDPLPGLEVVAETLQRRKKGKLLLFTGHPQRREVLPQEPPVLKDPSERLKPVLAHSRVEERGFVPHEKLVEQLLSASVAFDVYQRNAERELAITTRTLEYLWLGVPVLYADYAELSPEIAQADAGWVVNPDDRAAIARAVEAVLDDPAVAQHKGENARKLIAERFTWEKTIAPLDAFCREPVRRGKGRAIFSQLAIELEGLQRQWDGQREELQNTLAEQARENVRLGKEYDELKKAYEAHHRELRTKSEELVRVGEKIDSEVNWRDEEIRRLTREKADECKWRDDELRRKDVVLQEATARLQADVAARDQEVQRLGRVLGEEIRRRDEKYEALNDRLHEDLRRRDEELRLLSLERAKDIRDLNEQITLRDQKLDTAHADLKGIVLERDDLDRKLAQAARQVEDLTAELVLARQRLTDEVATVESERARLQCELERLTEELASAHAESAATRAERDAFQQQAEERQNDVGRLMKELDETRLSDRLELEKVEAERARLQLSVESLGAELGAAHAAKDELLGKLATEKSLLTRTREEIERERQAFVLEREGLRQNLAATTAELDRQRQHAADMQAAASAKEERIRWLEGVLFSMKNRLPHKLWKFTTYWTRRVVIQYPLLALLYVLNFVSNIYMQWWTQRHQQQVFPGM